MADDKRTLLVDPEQPPSYVAYSPMTEPCAKRRCSKKAKCAHAVVLVVLFAAVFAGGFFSGRSHHHDDCSSSSSTSPSTSSSSASPTPVLVSSGSTALLQTPLQGSVPASSFLWCRVVNDVCVPTNPMLTPQGSLQYFLYEFDGETSLIVTATGSTFGTNGSAPVAEGSINITITTSMARITPFLDDVSSWSTSSLVSGSTSRTLTLSSRSSVGFIVTWPGRAAGLIAPTSIEVEGVELSAAVLGGDMPAVVNMTNVLSLSSYTGASVLTTSQNSAASAPVQHIVYSWNSGSYTSSVNGYYRRSTDPSPSGRGLAMNMTLHTPRGDVSVLLAFDSRYGGNASVSVNAQVEHPLSRTRVFVSSPSHPAVTASQTDEAQPNAVDFMRFNSSGVVTSFVWQRVRPSSAAERGNMTWLATTLTSFANTLAANPPAGTRPEQVCTQAAASIFQLWSKCHVANHASLTGTGCTVPLANLCSVMASCGHALQTCDKLSF